MFKYFFRTPQKYLTYNEIKTHFTKGNTVLSLNSNDVYEYSGRLTLIDKGKNAVGYDSKDNNLVLYKRGEIAKVVSIKI
jgi:hypothetical protein